MYDKIISLDFKKIDSHILCSVVSVLVKDKKKICGKIKLHYIKQHQLAYTVDTFYTLLCESEKLRARVLLLFHTIGNDVWLVGWTEAEVVKGEQCMAPVLCQVCQQFQDSGHPKDTLLAVLRE